jgi:hypothetical protein
MRASKLVILFAAMAQVAIVAQNKLQPLLIEDGGFVPSGWMGDGAAKVKAGEKGPLQVDSRSTVIPHSAPYCQQWIYRPRKGGDGWAAVAWQYPENNWGDKPGRDWSKRGFTQVSVWARGVPDSHGNLPKVQFKAGGGSDPAKKYQSSFEVDGDFITLTADWKQYTLDLRGQTLSQVVAAFVLVVRAQDAGADGATFYLDDIDYR